MFHVHFFVQYAKGTAMYISLDNKPREVQRFFRSTIRQMNCYLRKHQFCVDKESKQYRTDNQNSSRIVKVLLMEKKHTAKKGLFSIKIFKIWLVN